MVCKFAYMVFDFECRQDCMTGCVLLALAWQVNQLPQDECGITGACKWARNMHPNLSGCFLTQVGVSCTHL